MNEEQEIIEAVAIAVEKVPRARHTSCKFEREYPPGCVRIAVLPLARPGFGRGNQQQPFAYEICVNGPLTRTTAAKDA